MLIFWTNPGGLNTELSLFQVVGIEEFFHFRGLVIPLYTEVSMGWIRWVFYLYLANVILRNKNVPCS